MRSSRNHQTRCHCRYHVQLPVSRCKAQTQSLVPLLWHPGGIFRLRVLLLTGYFFSFWDLFPAKRQSWPCANIPADPAVCQIVRASRLAPATSHHITFKSLLNRLSPSCFKSLPLNPGGSAPRCFTVHNRVAAATRAGSRANATDQVAAEHVPVLENIRAVNVEQHGGLKWCKVADAVAGKRDD